MVTKIIMCSFGDILYVSCIWNHHRCSICHLPHDKMCSVVGMATDCGLDGPGLNPGGGRYFPHLSRPALGPTNPPVQWVPGLSRGKERPGRDADPSLPSSTVVMKG